MALFPTDSDTNTLSTSTFAGGTGTGHAVSTGEVSSVSKFGSFVLGAKNLLNYVKGTVDPIINKTAKVKAWRVASQSLAAATYTTIVFDNEVQDTLNIYNTANGVFTAPVSGEYLLTGHIGIFSTNARDQLIAIDVNGTDLLEISRYKASANDLTVIALAQQITLTAGQYVRVQAYTSLAGDIRPGKNLCYVQFALLSY